METKTSKLVALMIVSLFCVTAFAVVFSEDTAAADTKTYRIMNTKPAESVEVGDDTAESNENGGKGTGIRLNST